MPITVKGNAASSCRLAAMGLDPGPELNYLIPIVSVSLEIIFRQARRKSIAPQQESRPFTFMHIRSHTHTRTRTEGHMKSRRPIHILHVAPFPSFPFCLVTCRCITKKLPFSLSLSQSPRLHARILERAFVTPGKENKPLVSQHEILRDKHDLRREIVQQKLKTSIRISSIESANGRSFPQCPISHTIYMPRGMKMSKRNNNQENRCLIVAISLKQHQLKRKDAQNESLKSRIQVSPGDCVSWVCSMTW